MKSYITKASELEFVQERFDIVKERCEQVDHLMIEAAHIVDRNELIAVRREYRLLGKLLAELQEGQVLRALHQWRARHNATLQEHRRQTRAAQIRADDYWQLSAGEREEAGPPPPSPSLGIKVHDRRGDVWIIDERYIAMLDRLIGQLETWLSFES